MKLTIALATTLAAFALPAIAQVDVLTYHNDNARTGQNLQEVTLTPANVNPATFGKLFSQPVDGFVHAQPLYVSNLTIQNKGVHNVLFVATEHNSVYALDADSTAGQNATPLWQVSFINPARGITTIPYQDVGTEDIWPEIGITGTPVIDRVAGTLFVVAKTKENGRYAQRLHALDITSGRERPGSPVAIRATIRGRNQPTITFDPLLENQRAGLLLSNGVVYVAFGAHGNHNAYHGFILGYNARTLRLLRSFTTTPTGVKGGVWQGGCALSADEDGNIYANVGNGTFNANTGGQDYADSIIKLSPSGTKFQVVDYFTPYNQAYMEAADRDFGTCGAMLVSGLSGTPSNLIIAGSKTPDLFVLDRDNLGKFRETDNNQIVQYLPNSITNVWGSFAYFNNHAYVCPAGAYPRAYGVSSDGLTTDPVATASTYLFWPGAIPSISANGNQDGIVWAVSKRSSMVNPGPPAALYAYRADNMDLLYHSNMNGEADLPGDRVKFAVPTIANGKVYMGTWNSVVAYGLK
ncbi:MAG: hypothetical protein K1X53_05690 [Candidatus Sumerlaeaceae bacterium]|nr:hypothetical protein [Candidatus Sumerlaeaceae bacterium]